MRSLDSILAFLSFDGGGGGDCGGCGGGGGDCGGGSSDCGGGCGVLLFPLPFNLSRPY